MRRRRSYSYSASISTVVALTTIALMAIVTDGSTQKTITEGSPITDTSRGQNDVETSLSKANYSKWSDNASSTGYDNGSSVSPSLAESRSSNSSSGGGGGSAASTVDGAATMSTPGVSATTANKLSETSSERPLSTTASPSTEDDASHRDSLFDGRSSVQFNEYGIDVREELRTADDDVGGAGPDDVDDDNDDTDDGKGAVNDDIDSLATDSLQSNSIKTRLEVSNLINADSIAHQQHAGGGGAPAEGSVAATATEEEQEERRKDGLNRKSTSLFDALDEADASSTPIVNHFAGGEQLPLNTDRNNSQVAGGSNEYLSTRNYNRSENSANSGSIHNKSVFNENTRAGPSSSSSSSYSSSPESPYHQDSSATPTPRIPTTSTHRPLITPTPSGIKRPSHTRQYSSKQYRDHHRGPFFEDPQLNRRTTNTASAETPVQAGIHLGTEAFLNCRVGMLREKTVMWVRKTTDKVSLLTVGNNTYSGDSRISIRFQYPNNWRLQINPVQEQDAGLYMCQVSTHPPIVFATNVTILAPAIRVVDEHGHEVHDRYYKMGSAIDLTCQIATTFLAVQPSVAPPPGNVHLSIPKATTSTLPSTTRQPVFPQIPKPNAIHTFSNNNGKKGEESGFMGSGHNIKGEHHYDYLHQKLLWQKDNGPLPKDVQVNLSATPEWRNSRISIQAADRTHSGTYSCSLMNTTLSVVNVQVLNALLPGEMPAAVQHNGGCRPELGQSPMPMILVLLFYRFLLSAHIC